MDKNNQFSLHVTTFHGYTLPETDMTLAGYTALIQVYNLRCPFPRSLSAISKQHKRYHEGRWEVYTIKHKPDDTLYAHLTFALKYEGVNLAVLKALFNSIEPSDIEKIIKSEPTGSYARRIWFFYEWLTQETLALKDVSKGNYVDALDPDIQYKGAETSLKRYRVKNNLPGTYHFCPLIHKTEKIERLRASNLDKNVMQVLGKVHKDLLSRAAAFLLLKDSKASYAIEGERPPHNRAERWGRAIGQAGQKVLNKEELLRLQKIVIEDDRFIEMGWRTEGGFIGVHDRVTSAPVPDHISARWEDVSDLMDGLIKTYKRLANSDYDPVLSAALIAFGFVFIHPFADGNGRIHRYLIHHVLAKKNFAPKGLIFPVSAVILERIDNYHQTLESYSKPLLDLIDWKPTPEGNVEVLNETKDLYRYFDATVQAEFLYECVEQTVLETLPEEVRYLERHEKMRCIIEAQFDMPDKTIETLIGFLRQNDGALSKKACSKEFKALTEAEIEFLERAYQGIFFESK